MKNALKLTLVLVGFGMLAFIPEECQPQGEGEMEYSMSTHQVELVAPKTLEA